MEHVNLITLGASVASLAFVGGKRDREEEGVPTAFALRECTEDEEEKYASTAEWRSRLKSSDEGCERNGVNTMCCPLPQCAICLEPMRDEKETKEKNRQHREGKAAEPLRKEKLTYTLGCGHRFHADCLTQWYKTQMEKRGKVGCPTCRNELDFDFSPERWEVYKDRYELMWWRPGVDESSSDEN